MRILVDDRDVGLRYQRLLEQTEDATVYQTLEWLRAFASLSCELVFVETDDQRLVPFLCKGRGPFRRAFSLPYDTYGGVVGAAGTPPSYDAVLGALGTPSARVVDLRWPAAETSHPLEVVTTHVVDLARGLDEVTRRYTSMNRRAIAQAGRRGVTIEIVDRVEDIGTFWTLYAATARRHGCRPVPLRFFETVYHTMGERGSARFYLARREGKAVACNLVLRYRGRAHDWTWGYDMRYRSLRASNALIDRAIRDEIDAGSRTFDLGTSPDEGNARFKSGFGARRQSYLILSKLSLAYRAARRIRERGSRITLRLRPDAP